MIGRVWEQDGSASVTSRRTGMSERKTGSGQTVPSTPDRGPDSGAVYRSEQTATNGPSDGASPHVDS